MQSRRYLQGVLLCVAVLAQGCAPLRTDFVKQPSAALPAVTDTASARYIQSELDLHPQQSGFRLLAGGTNALMSRVALADHAERSIDLQYFIFNDDATGRLIAQRLMAAADRGVRVRILLDDFELSGKYALLDALNVHPNIAVRVFNPFHARAPAPLKTVELLLEWRRLNRRMHNKSFIVDNDVAVIGGRNIGDAYFDADDTSNFRDLDVIAIGPVVAAASRTFDTYWNGDAAYPVAAFGTPHHPERDLARTRAALAHDARQFAQSDYAQASLDELPGGATADRNGAWFWGAAAVIADEPGKVDARDDPALRIVPRVRSLIADAHQEVLLISPYFVPGNSGTRLLCDVVKRGTAVKVLTNSLESTDSTPAQAGYAHYRRKLLECGVRLYELRSLRHPTQSATSGKTWSGTSLHAKAVVIDRTLVFIGSMNMDQRSRLLNTEMGVIVDSAGLAQAVADFFAQATQSDRAYRVEWQPDSHRLVWKDGDGNATYFEPGAGVKRRLEVALLGLLPIEGLL
ncbi:MAG TPA: phospholipase D family protein [Rudaea sp.]|nr:phospholipase D family protein [Rudaea sp.]